MQDNNFKNLDRDIKNFEKKLEKNKPKYENSSHSESIVVRILSELIAGIIIGFSAGYFIDDYFDTKPIFIMVGLILCSIGALRNIYKYLEK